MKNYIYQNDLIGKKQLRQLLSWSFSNYDSMQACSLADELKFLGFRYATEAGISISIEDLKIPFVKNLMLEKANEEILDAEKLYLKGKITDVERFQKLIDTWSLTSESLKNQIIYYFKNYDPLNSVYIMAFSGARGNLSQVRQLVGMRGLMSDPSGQIMNLPIKKNFREGLTITDYLMSGYGARKGIVDTALKTANSGYLTRRLIDVAQDILIREKDCLTNHSFSLSLKIFSKSESIYEKILGRILSKPVFDSETNNLIAQKNTQLTPQLIQQFKEKNITDFYIKSPLTCSLYRAICQKCYGWDLASENLVDIGEAIGILAGQSIGEPGTQLTMRTFHTGGIFTSDARQQIISPTNGIIKFDNSLKMVNLRTNRGEEVLVTKNSGSLVLIPENSTQELIKINVVKNTILFPKNNQYILKDTVIGELINTNRQTKTEIKPILSNSSGEIFIPALKQNVNVLNNNKLIWILRGQLYNSPLNSFINLYPDYKLNAYSYIFRTKIINHYSGFINFINTKKSLYQRLLSITNYKYYFENSKIQKLSSKVNSNNYLLNFENQKYFIQIKKKNSHNYLKLTSNEKFGTLVINSFQTLTSGTVHYDWTNVGNRNKQDSIFCYYYRPNHDKQLKSLIRYRTMIWCNEEIYQVNCEPNILLVEQDDFISKGFELIPGLFSKTSGLVTITQKNNVIQTISIKSGLVYEGKKFKNITKKLYYPGEILFSNVIVKNLSFTEQSVGKNSDQLLLQSIEIYEFAYSTNSLSTFLSKYSSNFNLKFKSSYIYKSNQQITGTKNFSLASNFLIFKTNKSFNDNISINVINYPKHNSVKFNIIENLALTNYIPPQLKYKNIKSCLLVQPVQFLNKYTILGYLEDITLNSLEIVKVKIKNQISKQIFLVSNNDCLTIKKDEIATKNKSGFVTSKYDIAKTGKIIIENSDSFIIQLGHPYFFPNCKTNSRTTKSTLQYKIVSPSRINSNFFTTKNVSLNYYNILKLVVKHRSKTISNLEISLKSEFSKLFLKKQGKLYSCLIPQFLKKFTIKQNQSNLKLSPILQSKKLKGASLKKLDRTILIQSSELITNNNKSKNKQFSNYQLTLLKFVEQPFLKSTKSIGLYSITEDFFEQDVNSLFCKNNEFIEEGKTIGLLNLEKEITGDIVQGLPRIEEILEARKKNILMKRIPTNQKKGLLTQKPSLDPSFEFQKLGTIINENDRINPHKLLKVYFNYYGLIKYFVCEQTKQFKCSRLIKNYEGSYKSFKKVQLFILSSVQSVYESQGVNINDKHLEVIIKQMTTKVLITYEGDTPLLRREVIDLYHIQYINEIVKVEMKQSACYIPLLLGITKAALNNPSFISAASFQETTRVLTKAAIEGRIDWLRGLKENIIIGHLIPAGTGSQNYRKCFKKSYAKAKNLNKRFEKLSESKRKPRQMG